MAKNRPTIQNKKSSNRGGVTMKKKVGAAVAATNKNQIGNQTLRKNFDPSSAAFFDDQPIPRRVKEINRLKALAEEAAAAPKKPKKRAKNRFLEITAKMGYSQLAWEDTDKMMRRIEKDNRLSVNEQLIMAKYGAAGRDSKEIENDYKELDEKARRKKLLKIAQREKMEKQKLKQMEFKKQNKFKGKISSINNNDENFDGEINSGDEINNYKEKLDMHDENGKSEFEQQQLNFTKIVSTTENKEKLESKLKQKNEKNLETKKKRSRLGKNDKLRLKKKQSLEDAEKDLILNAREIIPFGERVDAPPKFSGKLRKLLGPKFAQAGSKDLMLKKLLNSKPIDFEKEKEKMIEKKLNDEEIFNFPPLPKTTIKTTTNVVYEAKTKNLKNNNKKKSKIIDNYEREKIIEAYRKRPRQTNFQN